MEIPGILWLVIGIVLLAVIAICVRLLSTTQKVNLTRPSTPDEKPEWLRYEPPPETQAATLADGEGITLYNHDPGEKLAAPFAEQIEDIIHAKLNADPELASFKIDLGTAADGGLEFWVNGVAYAAVDQLPDSRLQDVVRQAIAQWDKGAHG